MHSVLIYVSFPYPLNTLPYSPTWKRNLPAYFTYHILAITMVGPKRLSKWLAKTIATVQTVDDPRHTDIVIP